MITGILVAANVACLSARTSATADPNAATEAGTGTENQVAPVVDYGANVLRFSPAKIMDVGGIGIGIEYEHIFGDNGMFGLNLPFTLMFRQDFNYDNYSNNAHYSPYFYFAPGFKIYPSGQKHRVTYAIGPSLFAGYGRYRDWQSIWNNATNSYDEIALDSDNFRLGMMVMNYVNFQFTKNFSMGIDAGLGIRYLSHYSEGNNDEGIEPTGQFSLTFGYRF